MKKVKLISLLLTAAMLLSVLIIPVSAVGTAITGSGLYLSADELTTISNGTRTSYFATPTVDGSKDTAYANGAHITCNQIIYNDGATFDAYTVNDAQHIYVYVEVKYGTAKTELTATDTVKLYIDMYNRHDSVTYNSTEYTKEYPYDTTSPYTNGYGGGTLTYQPTGSTKKYSAYNSKFGNAGSGWHAYTLLKDGDKEIGYAVEVKIKMTDAIIAALPNDNPAISMGYEIQNSTDGSSSANQKLFFFDESLSEETYYQQYYTSNGYQDFTGHPDIILAKSANDDLSKYKVESGVVTDVTDNTVIIDGRMETSEGWSAMPFATLDTIKDSIDTGRVYSRDIPDVRYSYDEDSIYVLYNSLIVTASATDPTKKDYDKSVEFSFDFGDEHITLTLADPTDADAMAITCNGIVSDKVELSAVASAKELCIEMKVELPTSVKTARMTEGVTVEVNAISQRETTNHVDTKLHLGDGLNINLSEYNPISYVGLQVSAIENSSYNVRFSAVMGDYTMYESAGFDMVYVSGPDAAKFGKSHDAECNTVYTSILEKGVPADPATYGGNYFFCFTVKGFAINQTYCFEVKPYVTVNGVKIYADNSTTVAFSVDADGNVNAQ